MERTERGHPRAYRFEADACDNPECGLHLLAFDEEDEVMVEIVMSIEGTLGLIQHCKDLLYDKAVLRDESGGG